MMKAWFIVALVILAVFGFVRLLMWADDHDRRERQEWSLQNIKKCEALHGKLVLGSSRDDEPLLFKECKLP